ncbi:MAG: hypothetical protein KBS47_07620, partial [Bacteroidales bacterium]|nr:hypothetical protein [Candidatus Equimonas enterica]
NMSIDDIVTYLCEVIAARAEDGNNFGSILIPEGIIEFIPEMKSLIAEINDLIAQGKDIDCLSPKNAAVYQSLPKGVAKQLTLARDPHGNVSVSLIETEKMLSTLIKEKLAQWKEEGRYSGKFSYLRHFLGYEGRCAAPSNYDANYCYALGCSAAQLIRAGKTGCMAVVQNTTVPASQWQAGGVPLTSLMNMEVRAASRSLSSAKPSSISTASPSSLSPPSVRSGSVRPTSSIPVLSSTGDPAKSATAAPSR